MHHGGVHGSSLGAAALLAVQGRAELGCPTHGAVLTWHHRACTDVSQMRSWECSMLMASGRWSWCSAMRCVAFLAWGSGRTEEIGREASVSEEGLAARRHPARTWPSCLSSKPWLVEVLLGFHQGFMPAVGESVSCPVGCRVISVCSLSCFLASGKCSGTSLGMSQQPIFCLQKALTRPVSCNSGLRALTLGADSYRLFIPFPSENKINCAPCSLLFLVACLDQPREGCCQMGVWCCGRTCWGEGN